MGALGASGGTEGLGEMAEARAAGSSQAGQGLPAVGTERKKEVLSGTTR